MLKHPKRSHKAYSRTVPRSKGQAGRGAVAMFPKRVTGSGRLDTRSVRGLSIGAAVEGTAMATMGVKHG